MDDESRDPVIGRAIEVAGGPSKLAAALGVRMPSIYSWKRVPAIRVLAIERVTGISRHELRPDLYPLEPAEKIPASPASGCEPPPEPVEAAA